MIIGVNKMAHGKKIKDLLKGEFVLAKKYGKLTSGKALKIHPSVIAFADWQMDVEAA